MNPNSDPFDEFEFKPLTNGLGFHKKTINLKDQVAASGLSRAEKKAELPEVDEILFDKESPVEQEFIASLKNEKIEIEDRPQKVISEIKSPLPRENDEIKKKSYKALNKIDPRLKLDFQETKIETPEIDKSILRQEEEAEFKKVPTAMMASLFDAFVGLTLSIVFLASMMAVIEIDLMSLILNAETQFLVQLSFVGMYFALLQIYMIISRSVAQCTLGEWAFDIHLAQKNGKVSSYFPLLIFWRALLTIGTGIITLPFLSLIVRRDVASYLTGVQLYQKK